MRDWHVDIGLEIHVQLATKTKIFSGSSTDFGAAPNTQASAIDLAMPGVLPTLNKDVYRLAIRFGLGVGAEIARRSVFDRKNYFYPDLPKGYQITQMDSPIVNGGSVTINVGDKPLNIRITRAHLEEDAGKSLHEDFHGMTGIDLNRAGTPLLEIVSEPEMHSAAEAVAYARKIHQLVTYLGVSDGNMAEGSLRCDANVSVRRSPDDELGTRTETKNVNSFRFLERAINYEIERQTTRLESGERIIQETRLYDPDRDETRPMRSKETATDYRYFPEPDLLPVVVDDETIEQIRRGMPELPDARASRYVAELDLSQGDAEVLTGSLALADYFEAAAAIAGDAKLAANWVRVELLGRLNREGLEIDSVEVTPAQLGELLLRVADQTISGKIAKTVFDALWQGEAASVDDYIEANGLKQMSDSGALEPIVDKIISDNPGQVAQFKAGKTKVMGFFVGQVMKATGGKANPGQVNELITQRLAE